MGKSKSVKTRTMDIGIINESTKYVMCLDTLDLALLPSRYTSRFNDNSTPLWTSNKLNLNSSDYFEFKIKSKSDAAIFNGDETDLIEDTVTKQEASNYEANQPTTTDARVMCHICNLNIPPAYVIDHENSLKHKAYAKITEVVLDRTRKHMKRKRISTAEKKDLTYFCGACACEIQFVNKYSHEKTKEHRQAVSLDRVLYELVALYTDEEHEFTEEDNKAFHKDINCLETQENGIIGDNIIVFSEVKNRLDALEVKTKEKIIKVIDECDMDKSYSLSIDGDDLRIMMDDGREVIVAMDNFNGFVWIADNYMLCLVCEKIVKNVKEHEISDKHIEKITIPLDDHHCLRKLDNVSSHCVICNKIVNNLNLHIMCDETHIELHQKALVYKGKKRCEQLQPTEVVDDQLGNQNARNNTVNKGLLHDTDYSTSCNETNDNRLLDNEMKLKNNEYKANDRNISNEFEIVGELSNCLVCNLKMHVNNIESHINGTKHKLHSKSELHYLMRQEEGSSNLVCRVCNICIKDDTKQIKDHVETSAHCDKYKDLLSTNYIIRQKDNFYCQPCNAVLLEMNELYHIEKPKHEDNLTCFKEPLAKNTPNQNTRTNSTNSIDSKLGDKTSVNALWLCIVCNVYIPNHIYNINEHNDGAKHKKNAIQSIKGAHSIEINDSVIENMDVRYQMDAIENEKNLMCKVCKVVVPNINNDIREHLMGKKHDSLLKTVLDTNYIECVDEQYICTACKKHIKVQSLFKHITQAKHMSLVNIKQIPEPNKSTTTQTIQNKDNISKDKNDNNTLDVVNKTIESEDKLYFQFKHHFTEVQDKARLQCKVCLDIDIPNTAKDVASHTSKSTHINGYKNLMSDNCIFETDIHTYFCAICVCQVPLKGEIHHAQGLRHTKNYTKAISVKICDICSVNSSDVSMVDHLPSTEHVTRILRTQTILHYCEFCKALMQKDNEHVCHKLAVKDKICFCTSCDPYLPSLNK